MKKNRMFVKLISFVVIIIGVFAGMIYVSVRENSVIEKEGPRVVAFLEQDDKLNVEDVKLKGVLTSKNSGFWVRNWSLRERVIGIKGYVNNDEDMTFHVYFEDAEMPPNPPAKIVLQFPS